jgi:anion-transporting  ArsA/GET3 family ATPase
MGTSAYMQDCLTRRLIFFTGKGGVGKSSVTLATALACQRAQKKVALASWNPYDTDSQPLPLSDLGIDFFPLETLACFREYVIQRLRFEKIYDVVFDNYVLRAFVRALPGLAETVVAGKILDLHRKARHDLILVDLPSSGHAISFFQSPFGVHKIFPAGFVHKETQAICELFQQPTSRVDLVALPEELSSQESVQLKQKLETVARFPFGFCHWNQCAPDFHLPDVRLPEPAARCRALQEERRER